ncbi:MAG: hypothetical protein ACK5PG_08690 [Lysobacterales bacterium]
MTARLIATFGELGSLTPSTPSRLRWLWLGLWLGLGLWHWH